MRLFVGCSSSNDIDIKYKEDCNKLLSLVFQNHDLVVSADDTGIMGIAQKIARDNHREVIGICHSLYLDDISKVSCDKKILVDNVFDRTDQLLKYSDAILFLPGGIGTVFEIMAVIEKKRSLEIDKPIIIYNSFHYFDFLLDMLNKIYQEKFSSDGVKDMYLVTDNYEEVLKALSK